MTGSLEERKREIAKVHATAASALLRLVARARQPAIQLIEERYCESHADFAENRNFLERLGWLASAKGELRLTEAGRNAMGAGQQVQQLRRALLAALTEVDGGYARLVADYLCQFELEDGRLIGRQSVSERAKSSGIRDLLMELRVVEHVREANEYKLSGDGLELYVWARNHNLSGASARIRSRDEANRLLGERAEKAVADYERERVGPKWERLVTRISEGIEFASYDIKSVTINGEGNAIARYIEVKAVSIQTGDFFWARREIEAAEILRERYFLYLVPVRGGRLEIEALVIIADPIRAVLRNSQDWTVQEDVVHCAPRKVLWGNEN